MSGPMWTLRLLITKARNSQFGLIPCILFVIGLTWVLSDRGRSIWMFPSQANSSQYAHLASHCANIPPISSSEFHARQTELANTLFTLNASAYIAEPGANTQFFGNFSKTQWSLSERPLLLVISPENSGSNDGTSFKVRPRVTILTPKFETTRAKLLSVPAIDGQVHYIEWAEEADPYAVVLANLSPSPDASKPRIIFVDNGIRKFIVDGLLRSSEQLRKMSPPPMNVLSAPSDITQMRERKSKAEIKILKCANEATLLAIRDVHKKLYPGIRESQARNMMASALGAAGLKDGGCLTLFGVKNAALPHGSGTDRALASTDFALFDCTASLHGVMALAPDDLPPEHLKVWRLDGALACQVDAAARNFVEEMGYGEYFTHRLGHGVGLEVHEEPYLRGGNDDTIHIRNTFSDEPGIYIEGKVGVRLEDCFYINDNGVGEYLTEGVGGQSTEPWRP
ncbi:Creatinase/aminopeptidase [Gymnopilus junonius]|uniref:Creatinase/aminopeptidase n=1 Tax=Gymnopilus junonius TaxID=109634 RepID=A0A9P5NTM6_GYMJU|nr:Creatinase/aminopeptidase [Gymnopilus junonius]